MDDLVLRISRVVAARAWRGGVAQRGESGEETAGEWRKAERILFGSPLSSLLSPLSCSIAAERQWRRP
jgi:hypothetical protein